MKKTIIRFVVRILFLLLAVMMLFPIYFMVIASLKPTSALFKNGIAMVWQFDNLSIQNYIYTVTTKSGIYCIDGALLILLIYGRVCAGSV